MKERALQIIRFLTLPCVLSCLVLNADEPDKASSREASSEEKEDAIITYELDAPSHFGSLNNKNSSKGKEQLISAYQADQTSDSSDMMTSSEDKNYFVSTYQKVKGKEITPNASPEVAGGVNMFVEADYILWYATEGGLEYVLSGLPSVGSTALSDNDLPKGSLQRPNFKLSSGFKVGVGLDFDYDGWDMELVYTWLHTHAKHSFGPAPTGNTNVGLFKGNASVLAAGVADSSTESELTPTNGSADWRLHFNVFDLELGRNYFISPRLNLRPYFGLKGTWQEQDFNISYISTGITTFIGPTSTIYLGATEVYQPKQALHYWGFGPRTGVDLSWLVTRNFAFFGDWAITTLWGQAKNSRVDTSNVTSSAGLPLLTNHTALNSGEIQHQLNLVIETGIGFRYDYWFCHDKYRIRAAASWEHQIWFNQNQFFRVAGNLFGDLTLQGLTLNFRFDF